MGVTLSSSILVRRDRRSSLFAQVGLSRRSPFSRCAAAARRLAVFRDAAQSSVGFLERRTSPADPQLPFDPTRTLRQVPNWSSHSSIRLGRQVVGHSRHLATRGPCWSRMSVHEKFGCALPTLTAIGRGKRSSRSSTGSGLSRPLRKFGIPRIVKTL